MKIVSWNINSIKARKDHVLRYLQDNQPDVLMVQELKGLDFPAEDFKAIGFESVAVTQKAYNGVAIFSKTPIEVILDTLPGDSSDEQARYLEFKTAGKRLINIYLPNGNPAPGEKYDYKLRWMDRLYARLKALRESGVEFAIGGDFNVIPEDIDCHDPAKWAEDALFLPETRSKFRALEHLGLAEAYRTMHPDIHNFTFWDYQAGAWQRNLGIRIDHFLLSPAYGDALLDCKIDKTPRGWDKPSDHTPIMIELADD